MVSMSKIDIAKYLRDYAIMSELVRNNPSVKIRTIYNNYMIGSGREDEIYDNGFIKMIRVYGFMTELRMFSFIEDISIDFLNENDLDFDDIKSKIFVNPEVAKKFSKKEIIRYIRNAFNHNDDSNHSKYNISVNGRFLEIDLQDVRKEREKLLNPQNKKTFHVKLDGKQLHKICKEALKKNHNLVAGYIDYDNYNFDDPFNETNIDNLSFVRIYISKKIDLSIINEISNSNMENLDSFQQRIDLIISILNKNNYKDYHVERYQINDSQKRKLKNSLKNIKNLDVQIIGMKALKNSIFQLFSEVIPLGMFHFAQLYYEQQFASWFMDPNLSFNEIEAIIKKGLMKEPYELCKNTSAEYISFDKERYDMISSVDSAHLVSEIMMTRDYNSRVQYPITLYLGYISDSLNNEPEIEVNGKKYDAVHIRNSFVHGRWFFGKKDSIELYDCESGNDNDYNFNWNESISLHALLNSMDNMYNSKKIENKKL